MTRPSRFTRLFATLTGRALQPARSGAGDVAGTGGLEGNFWKVPGSCITIDAQGRIEVQGPDYAPNMRNALRDGEQVTLAEFPSGRPGGALGRIDDLVCRLERLEAVVAAVRGDIADVTADLREGRK